MTIRPRIVAALMSQGAALCQGFTLFAMFKCVLLNGKGEGPVWARAIGVDVT
jgi:hypothetical protein